MSDAISYYHTIVERRAGGSIENELYQNREETVAEYLDEYELNRYKEYYDLYRQWDERDCGFVREIGISDVYLSAPSTIKIGNLTIDTQTGEITLKGTLDAAGVEKDN